MNNKLILLCCLALLVLLPPINAQLTNDDNVIITSADEIYTFAVESGKTVVHVRLVAEYEATKMRDQIQVGTFYGNYLTIDKADVDKWMNKPQYQQIVPENVFYDDTKVCYFDLYFDRQGKKAEVTFEKTYHDIRYFTDVYFSDVRFVRQKKVTIIVPPGLDIRLIEKEFSPNIMSGKDIDLKGNTIYTYFITNQKAFKREEFMPGRAWVDPHILVLEAFASYRELYSWANGFVGREESPVLHEKALEIVAGCTSDEEKVKAIYAWVQSNIRYIAFEDGDSGYKPDFPSEVLRKRYGDCKGMSSLLKALLVALQLDARLCWIGTNEIATRFTDVPSLVSGNHMICVLLLNKKKYYLDATTRYLPLGCNPYSIQGRQVLIEDGDQCLVDSVPISAAEQNTDSIHYEYHLEEGVLSGTGYRWLSGEFKSYFLHIYNTLATDRRAKFLNNYFISGGVEDKVSEMQLSGDSPQAPALEALFRLRNTSACQNIDDEYYIELNPHLDHFASRIDTLKRAYDYLIPYPYRQVCEVVLKIPSGYTASHLPEPFILKNDQGYFSVSCHISGDNVVFCHEVKIADPCIRRTNLDAWNRDMKLLLEASSEQIILTKCVSK